MPASSLRRIMVAGFLSLFCLVQASAQLLPSKFLKEGVPDFSQYVKTEWKNCSCAPTTAANSIWYFAQHGYPLLKQGYGWGSTAGANKVIDDLRADMNTTYPEGTSDPNIRDGWKTYCDRYYPSTAMPHFYTRLVYARDLPRGGEDLWEFMKRELYRCEDVLPLITWTTPGGGGHAVTMVGWDGNTIRMNDPATGSHEHHWGGEDLHVGIDAFLPNGIDLATWDSGTGIIDGVVVCSPVPEPGTLALLGTGMVVLFICRRRRSAMR